MGGRPVIFPALGVGQFHPGKEYEEGAGCEEAVVGNHG